MRMNLPCPSCQGGMTPRVLECANCALRVEASFRTNEFALLEDDFLQLLRVFLVCEGRIRDMEKALGISYPTVKLRLAALRNRLGLNNERLNSEHGAANDEALPPVTTTEPGEALPRAAGAPAAMDVLELLSSGQIDHAEAVRRLREAK